MIGARLELAREATGLSLRELVAAMDRPVSATAISKYERNEMQPSAGILASLARALQVPLAYLMSKREIELGNLEFRKSVSSEKRVEHATRAALSEYLDRYLAVEEILDMPSLTWATPKLKSAIVTQPEDAEEAAIELRERWKLGTDPLPDLVQLLEERGVKVALLNLPAGVFGSMAQGTVKMGRALKPVAAIVLNNSHQSGERQRFTLAHELAHLVLDAKALDDKTHEKAADRWAGAFLVPKAALLAETGAHRQNITVAELLSLKRLFGVSVLVILSRLRQLDVLPNVSIGPLWATVNKLGWKDGRTAEPHALVPYQPNARLTRLVLRALSEDAITESRACELLRASRFELEQLLDQQLA